METNPSAQVEPNPSPEAKPWWQSKTIQGAVVILVALIARQALGDKAPTEGELAQVIDLAASALGIVLVIVGRVTASQPLR
jgi:hypothetical protein